MDDCPLRPPRAALHLPQHRSLQLYTSIFIRKRRLLGTLSHAVMWLGNKAVGTYFIFDVIVKSLL